MRHLSLLLLLFLPMLASAQDAAGTVRRWSEAQALTRAAPTVSCLAATPEGMDLRSVRGYRLMVEADSGQTLSGAGNLRAYYYDFTVGAWARTPELDVAVTLTGVRRQAYADVTSPVRTGCVLYAADTVTVSGGTVTLRITAWTGAV